jgi:hypothetical protein
VGAHQRVDRADVALAALVLERLGQAVDDQAAELSWAV